LFYDYFGSFFITALVFYKKRSLENTHASNAAYFLFLLIAKAENTSFVAHNASNLLLRILR